MSIVVSSVWNASALLLTAGIALQLATAARAADATVDETTGLEVITVTAQKVR